MNLIPSYTEMHKQEHFIAFLFGPVAFSHWFPSNHPFLSRNSSTLTQSREAFTTSGTELTPCINLTSFYPLSYSQSLFCLPCWWCQQQAQASISLQCCALLYVLWEVQERGTISLFVVPSMYLHRLSTKHCRAAVELKVSFHHCPKGVQWEQNVLL